MILEDCRIGAAQERLKKQLREAEVNYRRIDRQLHRVGQQLDVLSSVVETLREQARLDGQEYNAAMTDALAVLEIPKG